jgi:hypothetical protein
MITFGAAAAGFVTLVTTRLGKDMPPAQAPQPALAAEEHAALPEQVAAVEAVPYRLIPRAEWGAQEARVYAGGMGENGPYSAANPNGWRVYDRPLAEVLDTIIIHHSALPLSDGPVEIQRLHQEEKGFADVGYQYIIDHTGRLYEGRPLNVRGAHTYASNHGSVGICLTGNFEEIQPSPAQLATLRQLLAELTALFPNIRRLAGHKDFNPGRTLCPGENFYPLLPELAREFGLA